MPQYVYILIDRGEFLGAFSSLELCQKTYNSWKKYLNIEIIWIECLTDVSWMISKSCKMGDVEIIKYRIQSE